MTPSQMDVDTIPGNHGGGSGPPDLHLHIPFGENHQVYGLTGPARLGEYDSVQAGMLQQVSCNVNHDLVPILVLHRSQQLEHIHMQSPIVFDPSNPASYPMANMYMTSQSNGHAGQPALNGQSSQMMSSDQMSTQDGQGHDLKSNGHQTWRMTGGLITPGGCFTPTLYVFPH